MFTITEETKNEAIEAMKTELVAVLNFDLGQEEITEDIGKAFDVAVEIVKKQFGF